MITPPDPTRAGHYWLTGPGVEAMLLEWNPDSHLMPGGFWRWRENWALSAYTTAALVLTPAEVAALHAKIDELAREVARLRGDKQ